MAAYSLTSIGTYDNGLVLKLAGDSSTALGAAVWHCNAGQDTGRGVDVDQEGNIYLTGNFGADGPSRFRPGPGRLRARSSLRS